MIMAVVLSLVGLLLLALSFFLVRYWKPYSSLSAWGLPYLGQTVHLLGITSKDIVPKIMQIYNDYGAVFELKLFGIKYVLLSEPELVKPLLCSSTHITKGSFEYSFFRPLFNDGLIVSDGEKWRIRRKLLTPSFHFKLLASSTECVVRHTEDYISNLLSSEGEPTEIDDMIDILTLKIITETAMGIKLNAKGQQQDEYVRASKICHEEIVYRYLRFWLYPDFIYRLSDAGKTFFKNAEIIHNVADEVIRNRKELIQAEKEEKKNKDSTKKERSAFLDTLIELDHLNPGLFTNLDIREEVDTFMIAGHNPSGTALKFLHFLLANHPDVQEKLYDEQIEILGDDKRTPTAQDLQKMVYLEMVIKETLRLYPSIPFHTRLLTDDLRIDENLIIKAGETAIVSIINIHRSKKHWTNPEEFIPERFAPGIERHPFSFIPFSAGPRNCIGQKYAMMEMKTVVSTLVRRCWLEPVTTSVDLDYELTLKPSKPILVKAFPRNRAKITQS